VVRVGGNHRPSFEYFGCVVEPRPSTPAVVVERELTLCLRYTPQHSTPTPTALPWAVSG
jgi:hypothetical protein